MLRAEIEQTVKRWVLGSSILLAGCCFALGARTVHAQAGAYGHWQTLSTLLPINPIHLALLNTGKVLVIAGSGNDSTVTNFQAGLWDPQTQTFTAQSATWDMFCNGMVILPDGRAFINGGNLQYGPFLGLARSSLYDPDTSTFTDIANMAHGRWYPTVTTLGDGRVMTFSGLNETNGATNATVEIYTEGSGWSPEYQAGWTPPLYPRMHLLPNGLVFYSGSGADSRFFNPSTHAWSGVVASTNYGGTRTYGSSVLLPLTPANGYRPRVMIMGGANPATATTEIVDLSAATPQWQYGPSMSQPRIEMSSTLLPNGRVLSLGGSLNDEDASTASLNADLYDPATNAFTSAGANAVPRLYHSGSLLLPDATVLLVGGNPVQGNYEPRVELYSPAYLFNADGSSAVRPTIGSPIPGPLGYASSFQVQTPDAADIAAVVLVRPGAPTHAFDMDQRLVGLSFTSGNHLLNVTAPPNTNIAPPGYYMLFLLNSAGVPSVATFVQLLPTQAAQRPTATIVGPSADVSVTAGQGVVFSGSGGDPGGTIASYTWSFPGGSPATSSAASPGKVVYATPGFYVASLTVTDNLGLSSQPATLLVTVSDFSVTVSPPSQSVLTSGTNGYIATMTATASFSGTVGFSVTGLPPGASASFSPASMSAPGSAVLTVYTGASTPAGTYLLTVTGTSGSVARAATTNLVVSPTISPCSDRLSLSYVSGTLNIGYTVGTASPAVWHVWLIAQNTTIPIWSTTIPIISPPFTFNQPLAGFPHVGNVIVFTTLTAATQPTCWDLKSVDTGQ